MRYPITPEYLASAPDPLVKLYSDLEEKILVDICRRFKLSGEATESAIAQIKILRKQGVKMKKIEKVIKRTLNLSGKELQEIFERAVDRNREYYDHLLSKTELLSEVETGISKEILAIQKQTHDEFVNLTQSLGFAIRTGAKTEFLPIARTYQKILDDAAAQVLSGGIDYNTAIKAAVKRLTDSGLQMVDYASGWHNRVDVAARRAVMAGVSQLSAQYAEQNAEILGTDLREVTAHSGARDTGTGWQNHKSWQGKVYSVSGNHPKYPSIYEVCGWGQVDGLEGANCRHHHFPFVDGVSERTYTDEQLANIDPPPFEYQGRTYTAYEATQKQRQIETSMRKYKRDVIGYEAAGMKEDAQDAAIKLGRLSKEYKAFSKAAGLRTQPERARVQGFGQKEAARAREAATAQEIMLKKEPTSNESIENSRSNDKISGKSNGVEGIPVQTIGRIDRKKYIGVSSEIITDEVVITKERIDHIKERHPNDYERFCSYIPEIVENPDFIVEDVRPNSAIVLKKITEQGEHFRLALRLITPQDNPEYKNSVITFMKIREKEWKRLIKNKKILYKNE